MSLPLARVLANQFAPSLIRFLDNPESANTAAGKIAFAASELTGQSVAEDAIAALEEDKALSAQFTLRLAEIEHELSQTYPAERPVSERHESVRAADAGNGRANIMVAAVTLGLLACLYVLTVFRENLPGEVVGIVSTIAGIFGACLRDAFQFEFGSSRGSKDKDQIISRQL